MVWGRGRGGILGSGPVLPAGRRARYKARGAPLGCRSLPLSAPRRLAVSLCFHSCLSASSFSVPGQESEAGGAHGVQLRGHGGGGGQVPRPRPRPPQHHAHRRGGGVAEAHAEELVVRVLRPRRRPQVRLRPCHARGVVQVPPPPRQLPRPRPRPPGVPSLPGRHRHHIRRAATGRAAAVLPHRRGAVTAPTRLSEA